jgi:protein-L-isoaspartate O-methyltransferase
MIVVVGIFVPKSFITTTTTTTTTTRRSIVKLVTAVTILLLLSLSFSDHLQLNHHHHHHDRIVSFPFLTGSRRRSKSRIVVEITAFVITPKNYFIPHYHHHSYYHHHYHYRRRTGSCITTSTSTSTISSMKAWTCHGRNQYDLVEQLQQAGIVRHPAVQQVLTYIDRKYYFPSSISLSSSSTNNSNNNSNSSHNIRTNTPYTASSSSYNSLYYYYEDAPYPIGYGQTISAPHMHAYVLEEIISHFQQPTSSYMRMMTRMRMNTTTTSNNNNTNTNNPTEKKERMNSNVFVENVSDTESSTTAFDSASTLTSSVSVSSVSLRFLDVGCGSGYITACFGRWLSSSSTCHPDLPTTPHPSLPLSTDPPPPQHCSTSSILGVTGQVYGMDIVPELVALSRTNIQKQDGDLISVDDASQGTTTASTRTTSSSPPEQQQPQPPQPIVTLLQGNGYQGLPQYAPFDIIHVGAAAKTLPKTLCQQLKVGGMMIVPIHDDYWQNHNNNSSNNNNNDQENPSTSSQTLYKIERLYSNTTSRLDPTTVDTTTIDTKGNDDDTSNMVDGNDGHSSSSSFNINEYRITPLLGVRYVPLVQPV